MEAGGVERKKSAKGANKSRVGWLLGRDALCLRR